MTKKKIKKKIKPKDSLNVSIIGAGYVGLVAGACLSNIGHQVICVDNDKKKIGNLKKCIIPIYEPGLKKLVNKNIKEKRLSFTTSLKTGVTKSEIIFICVGTPSTANGRANLSYVYTVAKEIAQVADSDKIVVEKSTVPVNTGGQIQKILNRYKKSKKIKFSVVSNPEFLKEGSAIHDFTNPDRIIIGTTDTIAKTMLLRLYRPMNCELISVDSIIHTKKRSIILTVDRNSAELIKHASNTFLALKISFINLVAQICEKTGADVKQVALGMGIDKRIGTSFLRAGIGYGGSCFPKDVKAFTKIAQRLKIDTTLLESIDTINKKQRMFFVRKMEKILKNISEKTIGILGLAFKPNTDDMREAPSVTIINRLIDKGAKIKAYDPIAISQARKIFSNKIKFAKNLYEAARNADALIILTEWSEFKNMNLKKTKEMLKSPIIIDGRNIFNPRKMRKLGFEYHCIGRK